jgi:hypothetical protein
LQGYRQPCVKCTNHNRRDYNKKYIKDHPEKVKIHRSTAYRRGRDKIMKQQWKARIKYNYGITPEEYQYLLSKQNNRCALCLQFAPPDGRYGGERKLGVDHDHSHHEEGKRGCRDCVRGLLCFFCNKGFLPYAEKYEHLATPFVKEYLKQRPLQNILLKALIASADASESDGLTYESVDSKALCPNC